VERVRVLRHELTFRVLHWVIAVLGIILGITGVSISEYLDLPIIDMGLARNIHIVVGLFFVAFSWLFLYIFIASGEYNWVSLKRLGYGFEYLMHEIKLFFKGEHIEEPIKYDIGKRRYIEKVIPTEILSWWGWFITGLILISTGLALIYPDELMFINRFWSFLIPDLGGEPTVATRLVHLFAAGFSLAIFIVHVYSSWVYGLIGSIIHGYRMEKVVKKKSRKKVVVY